MVGDCCGRPTNGRPLVFWSEGPLRGQRAQFHSVSTALLYLVDDRPTGAGAVGLLAFPRDPKGKSRISLSS